MSKIKNVITILIVGNLYLNAKKLLYLETNTSFINKDMDTKKLPKRELTKEELKLIFKIFLYNQKLEKAWMVIQKALKRYPNSIYWHEKAAQIAQWTSRPQEMIKHLIFLKEHKPTPKLEKKLLKLSIDFYQYRTAAPIIKEELLKNPTKENLEKFYVVWNNLGDIDEASKFLVDFYKKHKNLPEALEYALWFYVESGQLDKAKEIVDLMNKEGFKSIRSLSLRAEYYYIKREFKKAYKMLSLIDINRVSDESILRRISDLGWFLGDRKRASLASKRLYELGKAKVFDFDRMLLAKTLKPDELYKRVMKEETEGIKLTEDKFFFYAYYFIDKNRFDTLEKFINSALKDRALANSLRKKPLFYMLLAQLYAHKGEKDRVKSAYESALALDPNNMDLIVALLWASIDSSDTKGVEYFLRRIQKLPNRDKNIKLALISAYLYLKNTDRALVLIRELLKSDNSIDLRMLYAYTLQALDRSGEAWSVVKRVFDELSKNPKADIENYLSSALFILPSDKFMKLLKRYKHLLSKKKYNSIYFSWVLQHKNDELANYALHKMSNPEPWMPFSVALTFRDNSNLQLLLYRHYQTLPVRDRFKASNETGNLSFGYTLGFLALDKNSQDNKLYNQLRESTQQEANSIYIENSYNSRGDTLSQNELSIIGKNYLDRGYWAITELSMVKNIIKDSKSLINAPNFHSRATLSFIKNFDWGDAKFGISFKKRLKSFIQLDGSLHWRITSRFESEIYMGINQDAKESLYTLFGGKKNNIGVHLYYKLFNSTSFSLTMEGDKYLSQDNRYIGDGYYLHLEVSRLFKQEYPDFRAISYIELGDYRQKSSKDIGVIKTLMPYTTPILPKKYGQIGIGLHIGETQRSYFVNQWRPFSDITLSYNWVSGGYSWGLSSGFAGSFKNRDKVIIGFNYSQSLFGGSEQSFSIYCNYSYLY